MLCKRGHQIIKFKFNIGSDYEITNAEIKIMILIGSLAINRQNIANGGPNDMKVQPKNSIVVIVDCLGFGSNQHFTRFNRFRPMSHSLSLKLTTALVTA